MRGFSNEGVVVQGSPDSPRVRELSFSNSSSFDSTSISEIMRPPYEERIIFPNPIAWLPLKEEKEGEAVMSFDFANSIGAPRRRRRLIVNKRDQQQVEEELTMRTPQNGHIKQLLGPRQVVLLLADPKMSLRSRLRLGSRSRWRSLLESTHLEW